MNGTQFNSSDLIILLIFGILLLLVGLVGKVKAQQLEIGTSNKVVRSIIGSIGFILSSLSILLIIFPNILQPNPQPQPTANQTTVPQETQPVSPPVPTSSPSTQNLQPIISSFQSCEQPCIGNNSVSVFPEKIKIIYLTIQYQNFSANAHVMRSMKRGNDIWSTYECDWSDASSGTLQYRFTEPAGIASGDWTFTIEVNGQIILQKSFTVLGTWAYWSPAGYFNTCGTAVH
jgi:hypothetical protein